MANSPVYDRLEQIGNEIALIKDTREFGARLKDEFMYFIQNHSELQKEFLRRSEFYENLPNTLEFKNLLNSIHKAFKELHKRIDEQKLPSRLRFINHVRSLEGAESLSLQDIYTMLASQKSWPSFDSLNETTGVYVPRRHSPPWDSTLRQYELISPFLFEAEKAGAMKVDQETNDIVNHVIEDIQTLRDYITAPLMREHLHAFYDIKFHGRTPEFIGDDNINNIAKSVSRVTSELLFHLRLLGEERKDTKLGNKKIIRSVLSGIVITMKGKEYPFKKKNSNSALLCEKVYTHCRQVGDRVEIIKVYPEVWKGIYASDLVGNWKRLSDAVDNVNDWAKRNELPRLLQATKSHIERLA